MTAKPVTTIRMGAAHYDLTVDHSNGVLTELDLTKARYPDKSKMARLLCEAYGIKGADNTKHHHRRKPKKGAPHHGKHKQGHQPAGQLSGEEPIRQAEALDGPKKRSRRRRTPRTVPASGPTPH